MANYHYSLPSLLRLSMGHPKGPDGASPCTSEKVPPSPPPVRPACYAGPWPDALPGLGCRSVDFFEPCADCWGTRWSWVRYGATILCLICALRRAGDET